MYLHNTGQSITDSNGYIAGMLSASGSLWKGLSSSSRRSCGAKICRVGQLLVRPRSSATRCTTDFAKWLRQRSTAQSLSQDSCGMCMSTHRRRCQPWACEIPRRMYSARACQQIPKRIIRSEMRSAYRSHAQWPEKIRSIRRVSRCLHVTCLSFARAEFCRVLCSLHVACSSDCLSAAAAAGSSSR